VYPAIGVNNTTIGNTINASAPDSPGTAGTKYVATGYAGTGSAPTGAGNSVSFVINAISTLTWAWKTQYQLTTAVAPVGALGSVTPASGSWYDSAAVVPCQWTGPANYYFGTWSGGLTTTLNPDNVTMNAPKSVTANILWAVYQAISTSPVAYGPKEVASGNYDVEFIVKNNGTYKLDLTAFNRTGSTDFSIQETPTLSIDPATTIGLTIRYTPTAYGPVTAQFTLISNAPAGDPVIDCSGEGRATG
jgi:hypothetical protein